MKRYKSLIAILLISAVILSGFIMNSTVGGTTQHKLGNGRDGSSQVQMRVPNDGDYPFLNRTQLINNISICQNLDGGFGRYESMPSYLNFTSLSLLALEELGGLSQVDLNGALNFINNTQNPDGGWGSTEYYQPSGDPSYLYYTYLAVKTLTVLGEQEYGNMTTAQDWVALLQFTDGSFGDVADFVGCVTKTAWAVLTLNYTGGLGLIDGNATKDFLANTPSHGGVNYGNGGLLEFNTDTFPNTLSTSFGVQVLKTLNGLERINVTKTAKYLAKCQQSSGGFSLTEYTTSTTEIWTALTVEGLVLLQEAGRMDEYGAAGYLMSQTPNPDMGYLGYTVTGLASLRNLIIPLEITYNATTVTQGDAIEVRALLTDVYLDGVTGATTNITYGGNAGEGYEDGEGGYQLYILTRFLSNGTYSCVLSAEKAGLKTLVQSQLVDVVRQLYLSTLVVSPNPQLVHGRLFLLTTVTDREGKPVLSVNASLHIQGKDYNLNETGLGTYALNFTCDLPGHFTGTVTVNALGFDTLSYSFQVVITLGSTSAEVFSLGNLSLLLTGCVSTMAVGSVTYGMKKRDRASRWVKRYWGNRGTRNIAIAFAIGSVVSAIVSILFMYFELIWGLGAVIGALVTALILIAMIQRAEIKRKFTKTILSWVAVFGIFMVFVSAVGLIALMLGCVGLVAGQATYMLCPRDREKILREVKIFLFSWSATLLVWGLICSWMRNPYYLGGALAPPATMGTGAVVYFSVLYYMLLMAIPAVAIGRFVHLIQSGRKKDRPEMIIRRLQTRTIS